MKIILPLFIFLYSIAFTRNKVHLNFGKVSYQDFKVPSSPVPDSNNTDAVIFNDIGSTNFIGNECHLVSYMYKKHIRTKMINDKALSLYLQ